MPPFTFVTFILCQCIIEIVYTFPLQRLIKANQVEIKIYIKLVH